MFKRKTISEVIEILKEDERFQNQIVHWYTIPEKEAKTVPFSETIHPKLKAALQNRGIHELYTHQKTAFDLAYQGGSFVAVTPTASGKTLCYNLPVLQKILEEPNARALYIFPTKALADCGNGRASNPFLYIGGRHFSSCTSKSEKSRTYCDHKSRYASLRDFTSSYEMGLII
jgi:superfamily II DNA/RNA helicase